MLIMEVETEEMIQRRKKMMDILMDKELVANHND
jgi:hypothetical protein